MRAVLRPDPQLARAPRAVLNVPSPLADLPNLLTKRVHFDDAAELMICAITGVLSECSREQTSVNDAEKNIDRSLVDAKYTGRGWLWNRESGASGNYDLTWPVRH